MKLNSKTNKLLVVGAFAIVFLALFVQHAMAADNSLGNPVNVEVGVWLVNV